MRVHQRVTQAHEDDVVVLHAQAHEWKIKKRSSCVLRASLCLGKSAATALGALFTRHNGK